MSLGLHGKGFPNYFADEMLLGKRVASYLDSENNVPELHFCEYGIENEDHWLHGVDDELR